jgi:diadenosine tetraphosphatase ApaH/serine/threonine PP2A family protein phosphatase
MRYAILGDIHANLAALEAVLGDLADQAVDTLLQVGDVVGYGAAPREAIALVRERCALVVKGNHDAACLDELDTRLFNPNARAAVEFTKGVLTKADLEWLRDLPLVAHTEHCTLAHGTLARPERFDYIQSTEDADPSLDALAARVCFLGHTHVPVSIMRLEDSPEETCYTIDREVDLRLARKALINVGSVGQPRDEDPRACYAIWDTATGRMALRRVAYDIEREADRIKRAKLPSILADRLFLGI